MTTEEQLVELPEIETKERILAAALKIFGEKGYHPTTMAEIAEAANVGKGTLYWYFSSKEDLFSGIIEQLIQTINLKLRSVLEANEHPFPELLLTFTKVFLDYSYNQRQLSRIFMGGGPLGLSNELRDRMFSWHREFLEINTELIQRGLKEGFFSPSLEVEKVVTAFTGLLFAFGGRQFMEENWNQVDAEAVFIRDLIIQGITQQEKSREGCDGEENQ